MNEIHRSITLIVVIVGIGALGWIVPRAIADGRNNRILRDAARTILYEAKHSPPEYGEYSLDNVCKDYWGNPVLADLFVDQYVNGVELRSLGRDGIESDDDVYFTDSDAHIRKILKKGIQETGKSWGKGLAQGVMEGIREESAEKLAATKKKASELISRFRKVKRTDDDTHDNTKD